MAQAEATVPVRVTPRAGRSELSGVKGGTLQVRVTAAPTDGKANAAVCELVARTLGVPKSRISVRHGHTARDKVLTVEGVEQAQVDDALGLREEPRLF